MKSHKNKAHQNVPQGADSHQATDSPEQKADAVSKADTSKTIAPQGAIQQGRATPPNANKEALSLTKAPSQTNSFDKLPNEPTTLPPDQALQCFVRLMVSGARRALQQGEATPESARPA